MLRTGDPDCPDEGMFELNAWRGFVGTELEGKERKGWKGREGKGRKTGIGIPRYLGKSQ